MASKPVIRLYEESPDPRRLGEVVEALERGAVIIYPTDTYYALGCLLTCIRSIARIKEIKGKHDDSLSLICHDLSHISDYARVDNAAFRLIKANTPAPVTFILPASGAVPNKFLDRKRSVGIRLPDNTIPRAIVRMAGVPLVSSSLISAEEPSSGDPSLLWDEYCDRADMMVDGGTARMIPSTVVDLTGGEPVVTRQGGYEMIL